LEALNIWEAIEEDNNVPPLPNNPTMTQIKGHKERETKKNQKQKYVCSLLFQ
jgi:hypothetical protein